MCVVIVIMLLLVNLCYAYGCDQRHVSGCWLSSVCYFSVVVEDQTKIVERPAAPQPVPPAAAASSGDHQNSSVGKFLVLSVMYLSYLILPWALT